MHLCRDLHRPISGQVLEFIWPILSHIILSVTLLLRSLTAKVSATMNKQLTEAMEVDRGIRVKSECIVMTTN